MKLSALFRPFSVVPAPQQPDPRWLRVKLQRGTLRLLLGDAVRVTLTPDGDRPPPPHEDPLWHLYLPAGYDLGRFPLEDVRRAVRGVPAFAVLPNHVGGSAVIMLNDEATRYLDTFTRRQCGKLAHLDRNRSGEPRHPIPGGSDPYGSARSDG